MSSHLLDAFKSEIACISSRQKNTKFVLIVKKFEEYKATFLKEEEEEQGEKEKLWNTILGENATTTAFEEVDLKKEIDYLSDYMLEMQERVESFQKKQYVCECGSSLSITAKPKHIKSVRHAQFEKTVKLEEEVKMYKEKYDELLKLRSTSGIVVVDDLK